MRAVVLVGGFGTRLRPLTLTDAEAAAARRPPADPRAACSSNLARGGVDRGGAVARLQARRLRQAPTPTARCAGVRLATRSSPSRSTPPAPSASRPRRPASTSTFVVVNGDVLTDLDVGALVALPPRAAAPRARIHLTPVEDPSAFGVVPTDGDGRVEAFVEKPPPGEAPTNLINAGTYVLEPSVLERIPAGRGSRSSGRRSRRWWPTARSIAHGHRRLLARRRPPRPVPPGQPRPARRPSPRTCRVEASAADAVVDPQRDGARARSSATRVRVGAGAVVERSVLLRGRRGRGGRDAWSARSSASVPVRCVGRDARTTWCSATASGSSRRTAVRIAVRSAPTAPLTGSTCGRSSPAAPGSSARTSSTGCSPRATRSTSSTTSRPARWQPRGGARRGGAGALTSTPSTSGRRSSSSCSPGGGPRSCSTSSAPAPAPRARDRRRARAGRHRQPAGGGPRLRRRQGGRRPRRHGALRRGAVEGAAGPRGPALRSRRRSAASSSAPSPTCWPVPGRARARVHRAGAVERLRRRASGRRGGVVAAILEAGAEGKPAPLPGDRRQTRDLALHRRRRRRPRAGRRPGGAASWSTSAPASRPRSATCTACAPVTSRRRRSSWRPDADCRRGSPLSPVRARIHLGWAPWTTLPRRPRRPPVEPSAARLIPGRSAEQVLLGRPDDLGRHARPSRSQPARRRARRRRGCRSTCPSPARPRRPARRPPPPRSPASSRPRASSVPRRSTTAAMPAHADGDVGEALAPRPAERVAHDDADARRRGGPGGRRGCGGPSGRCRAAAARPSPARRWRGRPRCWRRRSRAGSR